MNKIYSFLILFVVNQFLGFDVKAQIINTQNFDGTNAPTLPANWSSTLINTIGWRVDSSIANISTGYLGASGLKNVVIRNSDSSGIYTLTSPSFSTLGLSNVSVIWASRVSSNFLASGSVLPTLEYSINAGNTWSSVAYIENAANSVWALVNGATPIVLPANANNAANLKFRWTLTIVNNLNGTYRMDDFLLLGDTTTSINSIYDNEIVSIYPNPFNEDFIIENSDFNSMQNVVVYNVQGKKVKELKMTNSKTVVGSNDLAKGVYFIEIVGKSGMIKAIKY